MFAVECVTTSRRWQDYAGRTLHVASVLTAMSLIWLTRFRGGQLTTKWDTRRSDPTHRFTVNAPRFGNAIDPDGGAPAHWAGCGDHPGQSRLAAYSRTKRLGCELPCRLFDSPAAAACAFGDVAAPSS